MLLHLKGKITILLQINILNYYFQSVNGFCQCDNDFLTRGLSSLPCGKDSPKAVEV